MQLILDLCHNILLCSGGHLEIQDGRQQSQQKIFFNNSAKNTAQKSQLYLGGRTFLKMHTIHFRFMSEYPKSINCFIVEFRDF